MNQEESYKGLICISSSENELRMYLLFEFDRNSVSFFEEYSVAPEIISKACELMIFPLAEGPSGQLELSLGPVALCVKQGVD